MLTKAQLLEDIEGLKAQITAAHRHNRIVTRKMVHMEEMFELVKKVNGLHLIEGNAQAIEALAHTVGDLRQLLREVNR